MFSGKIRDIHRPEKDWLHHHGTRQEIYVACGQVERWDDLFDIYLEMFGTVEEMTTSMCIMVCSDKETFISWILDPIRDNRDGLVRIRTPVVCWSASRGPEAAS